MNLVREIELLRARITTAKNVKSFGAAGDGTDATQAFLSAITSASATTGARGLYIPPGEYVITPGAISSGTGRLTIPSDFVVFGEGPTSKVIMSGVDAADEGLGFVYELFHVATGSSNVVFRDFFIEGENDPFAYYSQNQSAAIGIENGVYAGPYTSDVVVRNVWFSNLYGFSVHGPGEEDRRIDVVDCRLKNCSNGINVNANYSLIARNTIEDCEGIEASGKHTAIIGNVMHDTPRGAISAGGNTTPGATYPGMVVANNIIDGSVNGVGIIFAEATLDSVCANNVVRRCELGGISIGAVTVDVRRGILVTGNVVSSNCKVGGPTLVGLNINGTGKHHVVGNICRDEAVTGFSQRYACAVYAPNCSFSGNFFSGVAQDVEFANTATSTFYDQSNYHENGLVSIVSGATFKDWVPPRGNRGTITIADANTSGAATLAATEIDANYDVDLFISTKSGAPSPASAIVDSIASKTTTGFTLNLNDAPGVGTSRTFVYRIRRNR